MAETTYDKPATVRFNNDEIAIVERIRTETTNGVVLSFSDAVKIAVHDWALMHPQKEDESFFPGGINIFSRSSVKRAAWKSIRNSLK